MKPNAADTTKPDLSNVDPKLAEGPGAFETDESSEGVQVEEISDEEMAKLQSEAAAKLEKTGVILSYICPLMYMNNPLAGKMPVITNSNKLRTYTTSRYYTSAEILDIITKGAK